MKLFLIGFMGAGKTYWGRQWAATSGLPFADLDEVIETAENKSVAAIFEQNGEAYFRAKETETLQQLVQQENIIIACGGGTPCFNNNMAWMNAHGITVYLSATPEEIFERVIAEQQKRPLLHHHTPESLQKFIEQKLEERLPVYSKARFTFATNELSTQTILYLLTHQHE
ncbi:MAG: shikimate kinase [Bacteroidetes bacterium]|nr:shikimate kinase [Bacteroidota bacterium]